MRDDLKMKLLIVFLAVTLLVPAFLLAYQPRGGQEGPRLSQELWSLVELPEGDAGTALAFSKEFPAGYRDASMGTAMVGPIKIEGG